MTEKQFYDESPTIFPFTQCQQLLLYIVKVTSALNFNMTLRLSAENCKFSRIRLSGNSHKRLDTKKSNSTYRRLAESLGAMLKFDISNVGYSITIL